MSMRRVDLSLSLRPLQADPNSAEDLAARVRLVLETQPGRVPWLPEFGCDLEGLSGGSANRARVEEARKRVGSAVERWVPEATVASCEIGLANVEPIAADDRSVPLAESALASAGVAATLDIRLVLQTEDGPVSLEATMTP